jgi:hypothetical protein
MSTRLRSVLSISMVALCACASEGVPGVVPSGTTDSATRCLYEVLSETPGVSSVRLHPVNYREVDYSFRNAAGVTKPYSAWVDYSAFDTSRDAPLLFGADHPIGKAAQLLTARCNIAGYVSIVQQGEWEGVVLKRASVP